MTDDVPVTLSQIDQNDTIHRGEVNSHPTILQT